MKASKISEHKYDKGKFVTPLNTFTSEIEKEKSWSHGRMPEYIWIALIIEKYGRKDGMIRVREILKNMSVICPDLKTLRMSEILKLEISIQKKIYSMMCSYISRETLSPMTVFLTQTNEPAFVSFFYCNELTVEERLETICTIIKNTLNQHSLISTDVRFFVLYNELLRKRLYMQSQMQVETLCKYPTLSEDDIEFELSRSMVCATELMTLYFHKADTEYINNFWESVSKMTDCIPYNVIIPKETFDISEYMNDLYGVLSYLNTLFTTSRPLDDEMSVVLGLATFSYKRFKEAYEHNLFNSISGRSCIRCLIENYIMIKYLHKEKESNPNIWTDFKMYGIGQYKMTLSRYRDYNGPDNSHFNNNYIEYLVNEFKGEETVDMDTRVFKDKNMRDKAKYVDEKDLYMFYYDYDSSFEHGLWGAIRECSFLKCDNPAHKLHLIPDIDDICVLSSVLNDCVMVMNKMIFFLDELYGIPSYLKERITGFYEQINNRADS